MSVARLVWISSSWVSNRPPAAKRSISGTDGDQSRSIMPKTLGTATVDRLLHHAYIVLT
jgi:hypothetical protein